MNDREQMVKTPWINRHTAIALTALVGLGALITAWTVNHADRSMRDDLLYQARLVAQAIGTERIRALSGTPTDLDLPTYRRLKQQLASTRAMIPDCRFLYLLGRRADGTVFFFVDSEPIGSEEESPPGQVYAEVTDADLRVFTRQVALTSGPAKDRWGMWISALVPLPRPDGSRLPVVLGMDFAARDWRGKLLRAALPPILLTLGTGLLLTVGAGLLHYGARRINRSAYRRRLGELILSIAVMGIFLSMSAAWAVKEGNTQALARTFRQLAYDKTAGIAHTLHTLQDIELESLVRLFEASEYVSPAEFMDYIDYLVKNPVIEYWAWVQRTPASGRKAVEAKLQSEGWTGATLWQPGADGRPKAADTGDAHFPIVRVAPPMKIADTIGYDLGADPSRRKALEAAMQSGLATCSAPNAGGTQTVEIFRPAFNRNGSHGVQGFGMAVLAIGDLLKNARSNETVQLTLAIGGNYGAAIEPLAASRDNARPSNSGISVIYPVYAFGAAFLVTAHAGKAFTGFFTAQGSWLVMLAGLMLTTLLTVLVSVIHRKQEHLEILVAERTRDLIDARHRMELAVQGADLGTWEWHIPSDTMIVNANWAKMLGYTPDEIRPLMEDWQQFTAAEDRPAVSRAMHLHLKGRSAFYETEHRLRHKAGHDVWVLSKGRVTEWDADGKALRVCGTCLDTSQHRAVKEALKNSEMRLRTLIDTLPDLIWLKDPNGVYLACNKRLERCFGSPEADIVGNTDYDFVDHNQADFFREKDLAAMAAGKPCSYEEEITFADDGHRELLETVKTPVYDSKGRILGVLGIARDITERKKAQKEREELKDQLVQSQKMEAVGQLAGGVAHDLNNLLSPIIGYGELLLADLNKTDKRHKAVETILTAGLRARDLVRQLLAFGRKQTLILKPVDINHTVEGFQNLLRRTIPEDIAIELILAPQIRMVMADAGQIEQVLMNLVVNAADAMPNGGRLTIETAMVELDAVYAATHAAIFPGPHLMLAVSDTGGGMDAKTRTRIFEPFFTTKGQRGTGLGLATVFGIVKQHNGSIWVYSEPGNGTTFKVYLPVTDTVDAESETRPQPRGDLSGNETILLVEDDPSVRELAGDILTHQGYTVLSASNGRDALALAAARSDIVHLLLTDVVMPGMNGRELFREAVKLYPDLKVLYMSGYTDAIIAHRGVLDEGIAFIQKPFTIEAIAAKVREVLDPS